MVPAKAGMVSAGTINYQPSTLNRERSEAMIDEGEVTRLDLLLIERVEHRPGGSVCRECRFLGAPVRVTEAGGARRLRRACEGGERGHTAPDWPACAGFKAPGNKTKPPA